MEFVPGFTQLLQGLAATMTTPTFESFVTVLTGWVFAPRRTVMLAGRCRRVALDIYGRTEHARLADVEARVYAAPDRPLRVVAVEALKGGRGQEVFYSTCHDASAEEVITWCHEVYRQQRQMYDAKTRRVDDRIVSLSQPHVRPIKRGKAGRDTEFGAKLSASVVDGFSFLDHLRWDSFNESCDFAGQVETYRRRFGCYPESVHVDQIYRTRANRAFCKEKSIRMSGPPLGRPPKNTPAATKKQSRADEAVRNTVEGKFGQAKRRFGLARVMAKLATTSAAQISLSFLVMNLETALRRLLLAFLLLLTRQAPPTRSRIPSI